MRIPFLILALLLSAPPSSAQELVDYEVVDASAIPEPLVAWSGGAEKGAVLFVETGCAICHKAPGAPDPSQKEAATDLTDVGARLTPGEIRLMIVEPRIPFPETPMPAYYSVGLYGEAPDEMVGRTRLTALEIEQLVAYLQDLRGESATSPD